MATISRRYAFIASAASAAIGALAAIAGIVSYGSAVEADKEKSHSNPSVTEPAVEKGVYGVLLGVYEDAKNYDVKVPGNYVDTTFKEILPDVMRIAERQFVIEK